MERLGVTTARGSCVLAGPPFATRDFVGSASAVLAQREQIAATQSGSMAVDERHLEHG